MKRCRVIMIAVFSLTAVLISSCAYCASRMRAREFAVLCSKCSPQEVRQALNAGSQLTEQVLISAAYSNPHPEVINILISEAKRYGLDFSRLRSIGAGILNSAIRGGKPEIVRAVMSFGVNVNARDKSGRKPMEEALRYGYKSDEPRRQEIINILRNAGARR